MKKYIFTSILALSISTGTLVSCSDDFVERKPVYSIDSENYFNSKEDYQNALIGAYDLLQTTYNNFLIGEIASDNSLAGGESANDVPGFQQVDKMIHTSVNSNLKSLWDWMFAGVQRCNYILEFKDKTDFEGKEQIIAEARFLRAYYHFELVKWFGGIPLNGDKRFKLGDEKIIKRATPAEVYALIESDLKYAVEHLAVSPSQLGRATKGAAQALLGKAYLYQNKFELAAASLQSVIDSGKYSLVADYSKLFESEQENGPESVFEVQYTDAEGAGWDCIQCSEGNFAVGHLGIRNYSGPMFSSGWSFGVITKNTYDGFDDADTRKDNAILNIDKWAAETGATYGKGYAHTGFFNRKYIPRTRSKDAQGDLNITNPNNYRAIRYADVLLMAAEAYNRSGNDTKALLYLNQVRERAFGNSSHNITASGATLTDYIWQERALELVGEGHRFFDLVRTGKAASTITGFKANKNEIFPLPIEEIQFANGNWAQNPGY